jgi:N-formylglutamate amidohydrolase
MLLGNLGHSTNSIGPFSSSGFRPSLLIGLRSNETSKVSVSSNVQLIAVFCMFIGRPASF